MKLPPMVDLHKLPEDVRIDLIGKVCSQGKNTGVMLEMDEPEKIARYVRKVKARFPDVVELGRSEDCPAPGIVMIKFGPRPS